MSQCLHCSRPCAEDALFCEQCQTRAGEVFELEIPPSVASPAEVSPAAMSPAWDEKSWEQARPRITPFEPSDPPVENGHHSPITPADSPVFSDQALSRLHAAARWIAEEEPGEKRALRSRSARLKPLRDISADIQRESTPHPRLKLHPEFTTPSELRAVRKGEQQSNQASHNFQFTPLPRFNGANSGDDEKESDLWANSTDPLLARARPTIAEAAPIEEADIRRIQLEEHPTLPYHTLQSNRRRLSFWRVAFGSMVLLALIALAVDGLLLTFAFNHVKHAAQAFGGPPTLMLSTNVTNVGEDVSLQLAHFAPMTSVALTHDVQETLSTTSASSTLKIDANGHASASFPVTSSWGPGFHLIVAEDVATRDTASAMLQVNGEGPSRPPHLLLSSTSLTLGNAVQGADTIQPLTLRNVGDGSISWSASSDQPWLLVAPQQGIFSTGQIISVAAQRTALAPGDYTGTITIFSNVSAPEHLRVTMAVSPLPLDARPMISLAPPLLSFTTTDGSAAPETQVVTLSNPGQKELHWSLTSGNTFLTTMQNFSTSLITSPWLSTDPTSGSLAPGQTLRIHLTARGSTLLPGSYMESLTFSSQGIKAYDDPQVINVALTVQPHCGLLTSTGSLQFTAVVGQSNPSNHALSLNATPSCANELLNWHAVSPTNWITVNPSSGQVQGANSSVTSIGVNIANMAPGRYSGPVTFQAGKSTQTVMVQLYLQPRPAPSEPILGASPLSLNFSNVQGQANPAGQVVTITNNGGSPLRWRASVALLSGSWINTVPGGGIVPPGGTGQLTITMNTAGLTPGNYTGQLTLSATDMRGSPASGAPQTIMVSLVIQPPCTLAQPSASALLFSGIAGGANPVSQTVTLAGTGSCAWPLHWSTSVSPAASWLTLSPATGLLNTSSQQGSITVGTNTAGLQPGTYSTQVSINAVDTTGTQAKNSPQTFAVTLTVLQPCTLQPLPSQFTLTASQGQSTTQTLTLSETGSCGGGVAWTATGDAGSSSWLNLSATSGTDTGSGSTITIGALADKLSPGVYNGQITVLASNNGQVLQGSPQTISVTFQVTGYTVSGTIAACSGPAPDCTVSQGLGNASVSLMSNGTTIATISADPSGNFTFTGIPLGSYTISVTGTAGPTMFTGTTGVITISGNTTGISVQAFPSP